MNIYTPHDRATELPGQAPSALTDVARDGCHIEAADVLVQVVRPFVGAKVFRPENIGKPHDRTSAIDVLHRVNSVDADVRKVNAAGVELHRDGFAEFVPWASVRRVTTRGLDADGETTGTTVYEHAGWSGLGVCWLTDQELDAHSVNQRKFGRENRRAGGRS